MLIPQNHKGCSFAVQAIAGADNEFYIWGANTPMTTAHRDKVGGIILGAVMSPQYDIVREIVYINNDALLSIFIYRRYGDGGTIL